MMGAIAPGLEYRHVDVFANAPFAGNGLIVAFGETASVPSEALVTLTAEMRQFELIVVDFEPPAGRVIARIFTAEEELPFAGHPVIGAAAALHERHAVEPTRSWLFMIADREITVRSEQTEEYCRVGGRLPRPRGACWPDWLWLPPAAASNCACGSPAHSSPTSFTDWHTQS